MAVRYVAYNWLGQKIEGVLDTDSEKAAYELLEKESLIAYSVHAVKRRRTLVEMAPSLYKPTTRDLTEFSQQIASLLRSGISLRQSLIVIRDQTRSPGLKMALAKVVEDIESGMAFSDACSKHQSVFPSFYLRLLKVGEATGNIAPTMEELSTALKKRAQVVAKVRRALTYPILSLIVAAIASVVLITYSLPPLVKLLAEFGGQLPFATKALINISAFFEVNGPVVLAGMVGGFALFFLYTLTPSGAKNRDRLLLKTPVIKKVLVSSNMFTLTASFGSLLKAGVSSVDALKLTEESITNIILRQEVRKVLDDVSKGVSLGSAFRKQAAFPPILSQGIVTGETSGDLPAILNGMADYYEQETDRVIGSATELIQPAIIMIVAGVVGFLAVAVVSGIYSTIGAAK